MHRVILSIASVIAGGGLALADGLTLNFENATATRIDQNVAEVAQNEKEVEFGDFDNDDDLDVVVAVAHSDFGQRRNKLYRNDGGVFTEISGVPAITGFATTDVTRNAFFRDYNLDGWLDIIVINDANTAGDGGRTKIYINQHPGGVFSHYTEEGLVRLGAGTGGAACGGVSVDNDGDGDADLYVGNYPGPSQDTMYVNDGNGYFSQVTATNVPADGDYTVDVSSGDLNGDGQLDLLISNHSVNWAYYNNNLSAGSGEGDYSFTGSTQSLAPMANPENAMEPGDLDGDGDLDVYWTNRTGSADRVLVNTGNDGANEVTWLAQLNLPPSVLTVTSRKATLADLNEDGRLDVFVMKEAGASSRPTVLRNVTYQANDIRFIDWTPALAWPSGSTHMGWHSAVFDTGGDGDLDVFLGGWTNDHLFEQVPGVETTEQASGGVINNLFNQRPVGLTGTAGEGESDTYLINGLGAGAFVSVVLNGPDDYRLEILNAGGNVLATINRGGLGVEEAVQYDPAGDPAQLQVRITVLDSAAGTFPEDIDGDGDVDINDLLLLLAAWGPLPPAESQYVLELLSRSG